MIAYLDLPSGLSGDMLLGCLVDAGWPLKRLEALPKRLGLPEGVCRIRALTVRKQSLRAIQVEIDRVETGTTRHLEDVRSIIERGDLPDAIKQRATSVFVRLAECEAKVHGTTVDKIHFHEVGALDAIVDVVGGVSGLHELDIDELYAAPPPLGDGWIDTEHGRMPLPAPATIELLAAVHAPTRPAPGPGEWLTPTGAALLAELARFEQPLMSLDRIGIGAGQRDCDWPNIARIWLGERTAAGPMIQIDTNIDDMNPQLYGAVSDRLFVAGARDVWLTPIQMKKGRPAVVLSVLAPVDAEVRLSDLILRETTTLGLRVHHVYRHEAKRRNEEVHTRFGAITVKLKWVDDDLVGATPEYEHCRMLAERAGTSTREVYDAAVAAADALLNAKRT